MEEQNKLDKAIYDNTTLQLGPWHKKNRKLKKNNNSLNKAIINLKFKILMKKPKMTLNSKKNKIIRLDFLADVSEQI